MTRTHRNLLIDRDIINVGRWEWVKNQIRGVKHVPTPRSLAAAAPLSFSAAGLFTADVSEENAIRNKKIWAYSCKFKDWYQK